MRTREEQVAEIEDFCGTLAISGDIPNSHAIREWLKEAEERGFKRYQSKKTGHTAIDGSPSIKQWQHDQKEYFDPTIIEIVEEYAAWRDKKEAECAADTRRYPVRYSRAIGQNADEMKRNLLKGSLYPMGDAVLIWANEGDLYMPGSAVLIDAAMEGGK